MIPLDNSPLIDKGSNALIPAGLTVDERGFSRSIGAAVDIGAGEYFNCMISGTVFNDANTNGVMNGGELGLVNRTVYNDANNDGMLDNGEQSTMTAADGSYSFSHLFPGSFKIRQVLPAGSQQTTPSNNFGFTITLAAGQSATAKNFGVITPVAGGTISGSLFNDVNGNGVDNNEAGLSGWTIYNDANNNGKLDAGELNATTVAGGNYSFSGLLPGNYKIRVLLMPSWTQTTPSNGFGYTIALAANQTLTSKNFGVHMAASGATISGTVFNDANNDKKLDNGETGLVGWTVFLDLDNSGVVKAVDPKTMTDGSGHYTFTSLPAGNYIVRAIAQGGLHQTTPASGFGQHLTLSVNQTLTGILFGEHS
jgi:hypothetical protein